LIWGRKEWTDKTTGVDIVTIVKSMSTLCPSNKNDKLKQSGHINIIK